MYFTLSAVNWIKVGIVLGIIAGLSVIFGILILIVTKLCKVKEDEKVMKILEKLAGANCGGCGHSGCEGYAKALVAGKAHLSDCQVTSAENKKAICALNGENFETQVPTVAVVLCNGGVNSSDKFEYVGNEGCDNQILFHGGKKVCPNGCLGGKTCLSKCKYGAMTMGANGCAVPDPSLCVSCGACILACPKKIIARIPAKAPVYVACSSTCKAKQVSQMCNNGCFACGLCARICPNGAIRMVDNLPEFDYQKCDGCLLCLDKCPRKIILQPRVQKSRKKNR